MQGTQYAPRESILCMEHFVALHINAKTLTTAPSNDSIFTLENLCTRTAQSSRGGHSRRVEKLACLCAPCC